MAFVVGLTLAGPATAQVTIQVVDAAGRPLPAVRIDVIGRGEVLSVDSTDLGGVAMLSTDRWDEVRRLTVDHLGFRMLIVQADEIPDDGVIRLEPDALPIEGLTVEGRAICPVRGADAARSMWAEATAGYARDTGSRALSARYYRVGGSIRESELNRAFRGGPPNQVRGHGGGIVNGSDPTYRTLEERVPVEGYAWPPLYIGGMTGGRVFRWAYAGLDDAHAYHFATEAFGDLHDFVIVGGLEPGSSGVGSEVGSSPPVTVAFCPKGTGPGPSIRGVVTLIPGERLTSAEWLFETPDKDEGAGGRVVFQDYRDTLGATHLMASRGVFFHSGTDSPHPDLERTYVREVTEYTEWSVHLTEGHPCKPRDGRGYTVYAYPPRSDEGAAFEACVAANWGRE